jgi:hypothetical protein
MIPPRTVLVAVDFSDGSRAALAFAARLAAHTGAALETGDVPERLTSMAASDPSRHPLLVLGRRAGGSRGAAPGAVAYRVLTLAHVPVLIYLPEA